MSKAMKQMDSYGDESSENANNAETKRQMNEDVGHKDDDGDELLMNRSSKRKKTEDTKNADKQNTSEPNKNLSIGYEKWHFMETNKIQMQMGEEVYEKDAKNADEQNITELNQTLQKAKEAHEENCRIDDVKQISHLFDHDLDHILLMLFLFLDPLSLKASRQVCRQWYEFIKRRIWGSKPGTIPYKSLRKSLDYHWRHAIPNVRTISVGGRVHSLCCNDSVIVCGMEDVTAKVFDIVTLVLLAVLDCRKEGDSNIRGLLLKADIGDEIICTFTYSIAIPCTPAVTMCCGDVLVWRRNDWSLVFKQCSHVMDVVTAVKVVNNYVITKSGRDGRLAVLRWDGQQVTMLFMFKEEPHSAGFDSDGIWILTGSAKKLNLWRLEDCKKVKSLDAVGIISLSLSYPFALTIIVTMIPIGGLCYRVHQRSVPEVIVWNLEKGEAMRKFGKQMFPQIFNNGRFLVTSIKGSERCVMLYSLEEITNVKMPTEKIWKGRKYLVNVDVWSLALNSSCLLINSSKDVHVCDFWNCDQFEDVQDQFEDDRDPFKDGRDHYGEMW